MNAEPARTTVSLVLGSGGARGYAHIGAIEELLAQGFDIRSISGSSMGALIGGVHATGKLDAYRDWVRPLQRYDVWRLLDLTLSGGGFIKGDRIMEAMRELIGEVDIQSLPIAYTAVAVDLDAQREVWFSHGPLFDAIRASIAIPTLLRPCRYQGRLLVDGGLLNPLPVSPTLRDFTNLTIAVDVNGNPESAPGPIPPVGVGGTPEMLPADGEGDTHPQGYARRIAEFIEAHMERRPDAPGEPPEPGAFDLFGRSLDMVQATLTRLKLAAQPPDLLISVPRSACAFYEFHRADELIELGRQRTREALARWSGGSAGPALK
ncbi:MAG: patatin-like phospholipase family protein [Xanthomonadales bacterium]|nr:patatin-like phospholipase family protein [Xanthomonadales bacterium]